MPVYKVYYSNGGSKEVETQQMNAESLKDEINRAKERDYLL